MPADDIVLAILLVGDRYLLQLRDDKPEIDAPGVWGLFGGKVEPLEAPPDALTREIREELCVELPGSRFLWTVKEPAQYQRQARRYWLFEADFSGCWGSHHLTEGAAARCFTFDGMAAVDMPAIARDALSRYVLTECGSRASCRGSFAKQVAAGSDLPAGANGAGDTRSTLERSHRRVLTAPHSRA